MPIEATSTPFSRPVLRPTLLAGPVTTPLSLRIDDPRAEAANPFIAVSREPARQPEPDEVWRALQTALRGDPRARATRDSLLGTLGDLQRVSLSSVAPERVDEMFRTLAAAFDTWPDTAWSRDLVAVAVATLGVHLTWQKDGSRTLAALSPSTLELYRALARYVDAHAETYGAYRAEARADAARRRAAQAMPVLTDRVAEDEDLSLEAAFGAVVDQTRKMAGDASIGANTAVASSARGVRSLAFSVALYAESRKRAALAQLEQGDDLSQAAIMRLQEELQTANQLILAMSQILSKEGELAEQLARNIA